MPPLGPAAPHVEESGRRRPPGVRPVTQSMRTMHSDDRFV
ncbi:hypothetical protein KPATCC21470_4282 [Kitasatospora purpeofusca]